MVSVGKLQTRLEGGGKSPNQKVLKSRLREMLCLYFTVLGVLRGVLVAA
jgi:hypothetical protein